MTEQKISPSVELLEVKGMKKYVIAEKFRKSEGLQQRIKKMHLFGENSVVIKVILE